MRKKPFLYVALILIMLLSGTVLALASGGNEADTKASAAGDVYLYTGSPLILSNGEVEMLDSTNPDLVALVIQSKTLLPLKAISEYFGAEVSYDSAKKTAVIGYGGKEYLFPVGSKKYIVKDGLQRKEFDMDAQSLIVDGRTMVPLRVICEDVLGKKVSYFNRVIAVSDREIKLNSSPGLMEDVTAKIGEAVKARTMQELAKALTVQATGIKDPEIYYTISENAASAGDQGLIPVSKAASSAKDDSYSQTNVQVEGIDEADIVKTDGKYIYIAGNNAVRIVGANKGKLSDDTVIRLSADKTVNEIYVDGDRLVLLGTRSENNRVVINDNVRMETGLKDIGIMPPYIPSKTYSFADVYDISDPLKPTYLKGHEMEGRYLSSRKNGEIVYLVTNTYPSGGPVLPLMRDTVEGSQEFSMKLDDVMIMPRHPSPGYLIVSAINIKNHERTEVEAITAYGATMYMNDSSLYLAFNNWGDNTSIVKFELAGMKVGYAGSGEVPGYLLNQFSMDEYDGNLRVATTVSSNSSSGLYILDHALNVVGSVEGLAKGESIYSVRFMGDKGYIVTFRTIDPLFVFDLSDPKKPVLTGELEVPGFSNYLHPVGDGLILGIGQDTYDIYRKDNSGKDVVVGTRQGGLKFSLFDVSDMGKPKEISKLVVGGSGSSSDALYDHKAIMVDPSNENVALDAYLAYDDQKGGFQNGAVIVNYSGKKLVLKGILDSDPSGIYGSYIPYGRRVLYIGDELYYVQDGRITSYDYDSLKQIDTLTLH
ncbi:MAG TPA: beta-propeller domain-containing protein [Bacillota bacterium]|nr:beta-propeller domain-containing protein [Bacillota bacterium]